MVNGCVQDAHVYIVYGHDLSFVESLFFVANLSATSSQVASYQAHQGGRENPGGS